MSRSASQSAIAPASKAGASTAMERLAALSITLSAEEGVNTRTMPDRSQIYTQRKGEKIPPPPPRVAPITVDEAAHVVRADPRVLVSRLPAGKRLAMRYGFKAQGQGELSASRGTILVECPDQAKSPDGWLLAWRLYDPKAPPAAASVPGRPHKLPLGYIPSSFASTATLIEADTATAAWADAASGLSSPKLRAGTAPDTS